MTWMTCFITSFAFYNEEHYTRMNVIFRSKDFVSVEGAGYGFNNRRPGVQSWHYLGRVQHPKWNGWYECRWDGPELIWTVHGDERLFGLAAALKSKGFIVDVRQDSEKQA